MLRFFFHARLKIGRYYQGGSSTEIEIILSMACRYARRMSFSLEIRIHAYSSTNETRFRERKRGENTRRIIHSTQYHLRDTLAPGVQFRRGSVFHRRHRARFVPRFDEFTRPIKRPRPGHTRVEQIARRKMPSSSSGWEILAWNGILSTSTWILRIKESTSCKTASRYYEGTRIRGRHSGLALHPRAVFLVFLPFSPIFAQPSSFLSSSLLFLAFSSIFTRLALDGKPRGREGKAERRRVIAAERSNGVKIITPLNEVMASWDRFCCWFFFLSGEGRGFGARLRASNREVEENFYFVLTLLKPSPALCRISRNGQNKGASKFGKGEIREGLSIFSFFFLR